MLRCIISIKNEEHKIEKYFSYQTQQELSRQNEA